MNPDNCAPPNWWLSSVANLDKLAPGSCGALLRGSILRQQVAALVIATLFPVDGEAKIARTSDALGRIVTMMATGRLEAVIVASTGSCPPGILGALGRCAKIQQDAEFYPELFRVFADPAQAAIAVSLRHLPIDSDRLQAAIGCPPWLLKTNMLRLLADEASRDQLLQVIDIVRSFSGAGEREIAVSLRTASRLDRWAASWMRRAKFPEPPVDGGDKMRPIRTVPELSKTASEYRNCLNSYRLEILAGRQYFYRVGDGRGDLIAQLSRAAAGPWVMAGVFRGENQSVRSEDYEVVVALFGALGIGSLPRNRMLPAAWEPLAYMLDSDDAVRAELDAMCRF